MQISRSRRSAFNLLAGGDVASWRGTASARWCMWRRRGAGDIAVPDAPGHARGVAVRRSLIRLVIEPAGAIVANAADVCPMHSLVARTLTSEMRAHAVGLLPTTSRRMSR